MKKIAIVTFSAALAGEKGLDRLYFLADLFSRNGWDVELITSRFHHWSKTFRPREKSYDKEHLKVVLCDELGYEKNIQIKRILSHRILTRHIMAYLNTRNYDVVYCHIPDNHLAACVSRYAKARKIPFIIDIEDLWPEAMRMIFNVPILSDIVFYPFDHDAKTAFENASAVIGSSDEYRDHPKKYGIDITNKLTVYVGNDLTRFDRGVKAFSSQIEKATGEFWVTYAGTLGKSYDIATMIGAAQRIKAMGCEDIRIKLLGDGPNRALLEELAKKAPCNVDFLGYRPFEFMAAFLSHSDVNVNSLVKMAPQGFVSKIGDYLVSGKPMINTGSNGEFRQTVEREGWGINVEAEDAKKLADAILYLKNNPALCKAMGEKARRVAEEKYDRKTSYLAIVRLAESLLNKNEH